MRALIISDLHLGNGGDYDAFAGEQELPALLDRFASPPTRIIVNGDGIDFVMNEDELALDVPRAVAQARSCAESRATRAVFAALGRVLAAGGEVVIRLGNHAVAPSAMNLLFQRSSADLLWQLFRKMSGPAAFPAEEEESFGLADRVAEAGLIPEEQEAAEALLGDGAVAFRDEEGDGVLGSSWAGPGSSFMQSSSGSSRARRATRTSRSSPTRRSGKRPSGSPPSLEQAR
ncbi:hypothetical protein [Sorangium sp. So ce861]|uniref:hypothetical protein n=1 Tax=Sorangium sp. So ce861 TaxID=3133323 RepID=UPI003F6188DB